MHSVTYSSSDSFISYENSNWSLRGWWCVQGWLGLVLSHRKRNSEHSKADLQRRQNQHWQCLMACRAALPTYQSVKHSVITRLLRCWQKILYADLRKGHSTMACWPRLRPPPLEVSSSVWEACDWSQPLPGETHSWDYDCHSHHNTWMERHITALSLYI